MLNNKLSNAKWLKGTENKSIMEEYGDRTITVYNVKLERSYRKRDLQWLQVNILGSNRTQKRLSIIFPPIE